MVSPAPGVIGYYLRTGGFAAHRSVKPDARIPDSVLDRFVDAQ